MHHDNNPHALQRTFPFIPYGSFPSRSGTGTPQVKSRVTGLGCNPLFSRASTISPSVLITEFGDHFPAAYDRLIHSCVQSCSLSRLTYMFAEVFATTLWVLSTRQRGLISSIASNVLVHTSHWSPRASLERALAATRSRTAEGVHRHHNAGRYPLQNDLQGTCRSC